MIIASRNSSVGSCFEHDGGCFLQVSGVIANSPNNSILFTNQISAFVIASLCFLCYPMNVVAVRNFVRSSTVSREFSLLITAMAFVNIGIASIGMIQAISTQSDTWLFGNFACKLSVAGLGYLVTLKLWLLAGLSFSALTTRPNVKTRTTGLGVFLLLLMTLDFSLWASTFDYIQVRPAKIGWEPVANAWHWHSISICGVQISSNDKDRGSALTAQASLLSIANLCALGITIASCM